MLHKVVTLMPCLHNFCAGCYSVWKQPSNACPQCRSNVEQASRNHTLINIINAVLTANPHLKRDAEELAALDARDTVSSWERKSKRPRLGARRQEEEEEEEDGTRGGVTFGSNLLESIEAFSIRPSISKEREATNTRRRQMGGTVPCGGSK